MKLGLEDLSGKFLQVNAEDLSNGAGRCQSLNIPAALLVWVGMRIKTDLVYELFRIY